jgi:hypothetical protein
VSLGCHGLERVCRAEQDDAKVPKLSRKALMDLWRAEKQRLARGGKKLTVKELLTALEAEVLEAAALLLSSRAAKLDMAAPSRASQRQRCLGELRRTIRQRIQRLITRN